MDEVEFDKVADEELRALERRLGEEDPDELEVDLASGVLTLTLADGERVVVNSHRAAREIWMAAFRQAWHFAPRHEGGRVSWRTERDELHATLGRVLSEHLGRAISI